MIRCAKMASFHFLLPFYRCSRTIFLDLNRTSLAGKAVYRWFREVGSQQDEMVDYSRYFKNPYLDVPEDSPIVFSPMLDTTKARILDVEKKSFEKIENALKKKDFGSDYTVYTGYSGITYLYIKKFTITEDKIWLIKAKDLADKAIKHLRNRDISFLLGDAGPLALGANIYNKLADNATRDNLIERLCTLPQKVKDKESVPFEVLYGYAGYLYALLYLVSNGIQSDRIDTAIKETVKVILESGTQHALAKKFPAPLHYEWYNTNYLGAAHGVGGILYMLLKAEKFLTPDQKLKLIKPTLDWLSNYRFPSGNFWPSDEREEYDTLVHWCHGAPGMVSLYTTAHQIFNESRYLDIAVQCGEVVWQRGLLRKGYSICHGVSGNTYAFTTLFNYTKNHLHLYRAIWFADWCTFYPRNQKHKPDTPFSLFEGLAGLTFLLNDALDFNQAMFPAYELP